MRNIGFLLHVCAVTLGNGMVKSIPEAELAGRVQEGAAIRGVTVVFIPPGAPGGTTFTPYFRLGDDKAFTAIELYRTGLRSFRTLVPLLALLDRLGYAGEIRLLRYTDDKAKALLPAR